MQAWVAAGIFPTFSNGNNGPGRETVGSPASFPESFGVGATDINDQIASFSSRGPAIWDGVTHVKPQVSAPGPPDLLGRGRASSRRAVPHDLRHLDGGAAR